MEMCYYGDALALKQLPCSYLHANEFSHRMPIDGMAQIGFDGME